LTYQLNPPQAGEVYNEPVCNASATAVAVAEFSQVTDPPRLLDTVKLVKGPVKRERSVCHAAHCEIRGA